MRQQRILQAIAKWFCHREIYPAVAHCIALHKVESAVRMCAVIGIKAVGTLQTYYGVTLYLGVWYVGGIDADSIALIFHVETEFLFLHRGGKIIDIFHHQVPVRLTWCTLRILQRLYKYGLVGGCIVGCKFTYLICYTAIGVLISDGEYLVGLQG